MSDTTKPEGAQKKSGLRIPGFAQLQRLGKSLMLPIAVLPAAGILLRLGQPDLLGGIKAPVIGPFFEAMSAAGGAIFANLPLLFAVGVAIGFAKKADGSTALAAAVGYLVMRGGLQDDVADRARRRGRQGRRAGPDQLQRVRRNLGRPGHRVAVRPLPHHPIAVVSRLLRWPALRADRGVGGLSVPRVRHELLLPDLRCRADSVGEFIGGAGAFGAFIYGFANRMLIPLGLHHILNTYIWFLYGDYQTPGGERSSPASSPDSPQATRPRAC